MFPTWPPTCFAHLRACFALALLCWPRAPCSDVVKNVGSVIDLSLGGCLADGQVAAEGVPDDVVKVQASFTGPFLKKVL